LRQESDLLPRALRGSPRRVFQGKTRRTPMSSFEWNKIIASVLAAGIVAMVAGILSSHIIAPEPLSKPAYLPPGAEGGAPAATTEATAEKPAGPEPIAAFLVKADPQKGEQHAKVCLTCHTFEKGGPNKIGPNLWGVVDEHIAAVPNYQFSSALEKHKGKSWDPALLNEWLFDPQAFAAGTKMSFPGIKNSQQRADVIAYLLTLTPGGAAHEKEVIQKFEAEAKKGTAAPAGKAAAPAGAKPGEAKTGAAAGDETKPAANAGEAKPNAGAPATAPAPAAAPAAAK
jgi:cytochrome c